MSSIGGDSIATPIGTVCDQKENFLDLWKRSEFLKFQEYLSEVERDRTQRLKEELGRVKKVERKLKLKLIELENKERDLVGQESDLRRAREEIPLKTRRMTEEHQGVIQNLREQHAASLKIEKDKLRAEEARRRSLELEIASLGDKKTCKVVRKPEESTNEVTVLKERIRDLENEIRIKDMKLEQAKEREQGILKSRDHFRAAVLRMTCEQRVSANEKDEIVIRLQQRRADLLASGLYQPEDDVIRQLDVKIVKAISHN
jgi:hypothetical protein